MSCKLISLDTSIQKTGYAVYVDGEYTRSGVLKPSKKVSGDEAFELESAEILLLLYNESPDIVVVETTYQKNNFQVFRRLSMLIGVVYGWCISNGKFFKSLEAKKWRTSIDSDFSKMKREDAKKFSVSYVKEKQNVDALTDDEADAILIGQAQVNMFS